jgi:hypothetical protein
MTMDEHELTPQERLEIQRLNEWKEENGYTLAAITYATKDHPPNVSRFLKGKRAISESFKWRFTVAYGDEVSNKVFPRTLEIA